MAAGIQVRHRKTCKGARADGRCCRPAYRAEVYDHRAGKKLRRTFDSKSAARLWRQDALVAMRQGEMTVVAPAGPTVAAALEGLTTGMAKGTILDRSGRPYRASTVRSYKEAIRRYLAPKLGHLRLTEVRRADVQRLVDDMHAAGLAGSTVRNKLDPLRVLYRRAMQDEQIGRSPVEKLRLPALTSEPPQSRRPRKGRGASRRAARR